MNVYLSEIHKNQHDPMLIENLFDCTFNEWHYETDELKENSLFIVEPNWIDQFVTCRPDMSLIRNKRVLILHHYKSLSFSYNLSAYFKLLTRVGFEPKNIFIITQLQYDTSTILDQMPGVNVLVYDRWLIQLFDRQLSEFGHVAKTNNSNELTMKKFSVLIRRFEQIRFNFMCELISRNLLDDFNYTFANHTPPIQEPVATSAMKSLIPTNLETSRSKIESWINGIPYEVKPAIGLHTHQREYDDYPLNIDEYFDKSRINVVFETEPDIGASFLTEKTYKSILFKKPFIIVTQKNGLKALRASGYQTFGHVIDESYDDIEDYDERVQVILNEITRLNNMPEGEFNNLIAACEPAISHNYDTLFALAYSPIPKEFCIKSLTTF